MAGVRQANCSTPPKIAGRRIWPPRPNAGIRRRHRGNEPEAFAERVRRLREQYKRWPALLQRFDKAGLP
jgi:hypothetical protein